MGEKEEWVMVPVEPTAEMVDRGAEEADWYSHNARYCYAAMLAAAPQAPAPAVEEEPVAWMHPEQLSALKKAKDTSATCSVWNVPGAMPSGTSLRVPLYATPQPAEQQPVAEVKYGGYTSGNELVWTKGAGLQFLPAGTKLYAASIHAPTPVAYLDVGAGGYMDLGTDLTEDQIGSLPWGRHILAIVGTHGADGYVPAERPFDYTEAYQGARQDLAIWKRRALEAERRVRDQDQIIDRMGDDLNAINGPTFMGEPLLPKQSAEHRPDPALCDFYEAKDYPSLVRELVGHVK